MFLRRNSSRSKQASQQDIALVQMQLAAKLRNRQWHDYLCGKRNGLLARLGQQGHSPNSPSTHNFEVPAQAREGSEVVNAANGSLADPLVPEGDLSVDYPAPWGGAVGEGFSEQTDSDVRTASARGEGKAVDPLESRDDGVVLDRAYSSDVAHSTDSTVSTWWSDSKNALRQ